MPAAQKPAGHAPMSALRPSGIGRRKHEHEVASTMSNPQLPEATSGPLSIRSRGLYSEQLSETVSQPDLAVRG